MILVQILDANVITIAVMSTKSLLWQVQIDLQAEKKLLQCSHDLLM